MIRQLGRISPPPACGRFSIGDIDVSISSDALNPLEDFARLYPNSTGVRTQQDRSINMRIKFSRPSLMRRRRYAIDGDGDEIFTGRRYAEVLPYLEWGINLRVMKTRREFLQFHAASLTRNGQAFVFPAQSGSGKSTLAAGLMARGWSYGTDELTLVDPQSLRIHPFPKALCIKFGSFPVVESLGLSILKGNNYVKALKGRVGYVVPTTKPATSNPFRFLVFPKYTEHFEPRLTPMSRSHAAMALAACSVNRHIFGDSAVSIIARIVRGAQCFRLETGQLNATCKLLETLV